MSVTTLILLVSERYPTLHLIQLHVCIFMSTVFDLHLFLKNLDHQHDLHNDVKARLVLLLVYDISLLVIGDTFPYTKLNIVRSTQNRKKSNKEVTHKRQKESIIGIKV